jgi:glucosamine kinase
MFLHLQRNMANNILVGDIGSTKSVWRKNFGSSAGILLHGYNPVVHDVRIGEQLLIELTHALEGIHPDFIYYFGAGIIDQAAVDRLSGMAKQFFPEASLVIESDLMGACMAACGRNAGTVAILGTGSNAAVFDGTAIARRATTLGYMIGDEGSGNEIGKHLARAYFYHTIPTHLRSHLDPFYHNDRSAFLQNLYTSDAPNQFLAEAVKGIAEVKEDPWIDQLVRTCIAGFIQTHLLPLNAIGPIHVIGSIGYIFSAIVTEEITRAGLTPGQIIRDPVSLLYEQLNHDKST